MDGTDILLKINNDPETVKIVFSGFSDEEIAKTAADYGADNFLVKPVKLEKLLSTIQEKLCVA
jgi:YesN/AraC family two-component response regulator